MVYLTREMIKSVLVMTEKKLEQEKSGGEFEKKLFNVMIGAYKISLNIK